MDGHGGGDFGGHHGGHFGGGHHGGHHHSDSGWVPVGDSHRSRCGRSWVSHTGWPAVAVLIAVIVVGVLLTH